MKIGIIARADATGLGVQSRNWVRLLDPDKVIIIDSTSFNGNLQYPERYAGYNSITINGFIKDEDIDAVLSGIDMILTFEIPYSYELVRRAKERGVRVVIQNNWEFTDYLQNKELTLPDKLVNHSYWCLDEQRRLFPGITEYCPTPLFLEDYQEVYEHNLARSGKPRLLHVAGRRTHLDRNGTEDLLKAVSLIPEDVEFDLVVKTQSVDIQGCGLDSRVVIDSDSPVDEKELYRDFDAMILPRRYAGASLPMNEALAAGLPVIMTDISPNNKILPSRWLVRSELKTSFMARTRIDVYSADHKSLADAISLATSFGVSEKKKARKIAIKEYSSKGVKKKWNNIVRSMY